MSYFDLYCVFTLIPGIGDFFAVAAIFSFIWFFICAASIPEHEREVMTNKKFFWIFGFPLLISLLCISAWIIIPSKSDMLSIVGIEKVSNIKGADKLPENLVKFLNKELSK